MMHDSFSGIGHGFGWIIMTSGTLLLIVIAVFVIAFIAMLFRRSSGGADPEASVESRSQSDMTDHHPEY